MKNAALKKPAKAPKPPRTGGGAGASVIAVLSLLVALGAAAVSVYALDQARDAKSRAAAMIANPPAPAPVATTATTPAATPSPTASPTPQFAADLVAAQLQVPIPTGCLSAFVDVDSRQVGVEVGHDLYLTTCLGSASLRVDATDAAVVAPTDATAATCATLLAGITQTQDVVVSATPDTTVCLLTDKEAAVSQSIPQRIAIVRVLSVSTDRVVTLSVSTFRVPDAG